MTPRTCLTGVLLMVLGCGGAVSDPPTTESPPPPVPGTDDGVGVAPPSDRANNPDPAWSCLDASSTKGLPASEVSVALAIRDTKVRPLALAPVKACATADDATCAGARTGKTSTDGRLVMQVPTGSDGFAGYFEISRPGGITNLVFASPPIAKDAPDYARTYWAADDIVELATFASVSAKKDVGTVMLDTNDCRKDSPGMGVTLSVSPWPAGVAVVYTRQQTGGVVLSATATATDASGRATIFNLPEGRYEITGKIATGRIVGRTMIHVRKNAVSTLTVGPAR